MSPIAKALIDVCHHLATTAPGALADIFAVHAHAITEHEAVNQKIIEGMAEGARVLEIDGTLVPMDEPAPAEHEHTKSTAKKGAATK